MPHLSSFGTIGGMPPLELVAQTTAVAPATDLLTVLSRGGTGALIVALCVAVFVLYRRAEKLQDALVESHKKHGDELTRIVSEQHTRYADIANRYTEMLATVNNARVEEMKVVTQAAQALRDEGDPGRSGARRGRP